MWSGLKNQDVLEMAASLALRPWPLPMCEKKLPKKLPRERERERARVKEFNNTDKGQGAHAGYSSVVERVSPSLD